MSVPNVVIKVTHEEGGEWILISIHSFQMPAGAEWDVLNGWRSSTPSPLDERGYDQTDVRNP
jgi:hypothetical protein